MLAVWTLAAPVSGQPLTIAAASDLQGALEDVVPRFEQETGVPVRISFGSSGNFFAQIQNGAPFDVFLSADIDYPRRLEQAGLGEAGTLYRYAIGQLVLWTLKSNAALGTSGLQGLTAAGVRRVAIANPDHAPYGRAAVAALRHAGLYEQVRTKLVLGENIAQAAQFVQSGNAEVGIIARSIALMPALQAVGVSVELPPDAYPPIEQGAIVVRASKHKDTARRFLAFLRTPDIGAVMRRFGFVVPEEP
jgi:molybdate transport system substrate-binding protein